MTPHTLETDELTAQQACNTGGSGLADLSLFFHERTADVTPWAPALDPHQQILGRLPYLAAVDPHSNQVFRSVFSSIAPIHYTRIRPIGRCPDLALF